ncbi:MAG: single-stranded DNA-binding protein [Ruminococcaceae bacterium]|nr:single-stranded DNA-binding protein [Oscillospiraceae bacterium]
MNKVVLVGRLARDPELRTTQSGTSVVSFTVACDRRFARQGEERTADFISCVAWNKTAEFVSRYFTKGMRIALDGRIQTRTYDDQNGNKRYITEVVVEDVEFAQSKNESGGMAQDSGFSAPQTFAAPQAPSADIDGFMPVEEEDLPF